MAERRINDRRGDSAEESNERRITPRFTSHELNSSLIMIRTWLRVFFAFAIAATIVEVVWAFIKTTGSFTQGLFFGVVFGVLAALFGKANYLIKIYLENHSINNLNRIHEQFQYLFGYLAILSILFYVFGFMHRV